MSGFFDATIIANDSWVLIFNQLTPFEVFKCTQVCKHWKQIINGKKEFQQKLVEYVGFNQLELAKKLVRQELIRNDYPYQGTLRENLSWENLSKFSYLAKIQAQLDPLKAIATIQEFLKIPNLLRKIQLSSPTNDPYQLNDEKAFYRNITEVMKFAAKKFPEKNKDLANHILSIFCSQPYRAKALTHFLKKNVVEKDLSLLSHIGNKDSIPENSYYWIKASLDCFSVFSKKSVNEAANLVHKIKSTLESTSKKITKDIKYKGYMKLALFEKERGNEVQAKDAFKKAYSILEKVTPGTNSPYFSNKNDQYLLKVEFLSKGITINRTEAEIRINELKKINIQDTQTRYKVLTELAKIEISQGIEPKEIESAKAILLSIIKKNGFTSDSACALAEIAREEAKIDPNLARETLEFITKNGERDPLFISLIDRSWAIVEIAEKTKNQVDFLEAQNNLLTHIKGTLSRFEEGMELFVKIMQLQLQFNLVKEAMDTLEIVKKQLANLQKESPYLKATIRVQVLFNLALNILKAGAEIEKKQLKI